MLFDNETFWTRFALIILGLAAIYVLIDLLIFRRRPRRAQKQNLLINILLLVWFVAVMFLAYEMLSKYPKLFFQTLLDKILPSSVLALATTGIVLIFKTSTTTNFAQGMIATFGAFVAAETALAVAEKYTQMTAIELGLVSMAAGTVVAFLIGLMIDVFVIRKSKFPSPVGKQMITMGLVLAFSGVMPLIFGNIPFTINRFDGENIKFDLELGDLVIKNLRLAKNALYAFAITAGLLIILFSALRFTKWGLGVRATSSNEKVAEMMGVNTRVITAMSWAIAGALGGVSAFLLASNGNLVSLSLMSGTQVNGFMAAVMGGFSSFAGPLIGSVLINIMFGLISYFGSLWSNLIVYGIILLVVLVKPLGLFGIKIAKKV